MPNYKPYSFSKQFGNDPFEYTKSNLNLSSMPPLNMGSQPAASASKGISDIAGTAAKANPIMMGIGLAGAVAGGISGLLAGRDLKRLSKQVPQYGRSQFPGQMLGRAQQELNSNPFLSAQNRSIQGRQSNSMAAASRAISDPSQMLSMISAYNAQAGQDAYNNDLANYQQRGQRLNDLYNAQMTNYREDQNVYDNSMTAFNSKTNLVNAANQTRTNAINGMAGAFLAGSKAI